MKKVLGIVLALALMLTLALAIPASAAITELVNIDKISLVDAGGGEVAVVSNGEEWGQIKPYVQSGATQIKFNGWYAPPKPLLDIGFQTDDGDIAWGFGRNDGTGNTVATWNGFDENGPWTLRASGTIAIQEGVHVFKVVAKFTDETTKVIHEAEYYNNDEVVPSWIDVTGNKNVGQWLQSAGAYSAAAFTANASFTGVRIPQMWSSRIDGGKSVTFDISLYAFNQTVANSMTAEPLATLRVNPAGDQSAGNTIKFGSALPAGQYVLVVTFVEGEAGAYTVLPESGDAAKATYVNSGLGGDQVNKTFNFGVKTNQPENFFGEPPKENVAYGKTVFADLNGGIASDRTYWRPEFLTDGVAQNTVDGNALGWGFATLGAGTACDCSAYVDLGAVYSVDGITVVPMQWVPTVTFPGAYELYASVDGENWNLIESVPAKAASTGANDVFTFDAVEARFIRLKVTSHTGFWADANAVYSGYGELQVFGKYSSESDVGGTPAYVSYEAVFSKDEVVANDGTADTECANYGGNPALIVANLGDKVGQEVRFWGWAVAKRPIEAFGYSIDGGDIVYDDSFKVAAEQGVIDVGTNWGTAPYGESTRYKIYVPFDSIPDKIELYAKIGDQDVLFWTIIPGYTNYTGDLNYGAPFDAEVPWHGYTSGTLKYQIVFNTDVSFNKIIFPQTWASAGCPIKVTLAPDGHMDGEPVFTGEVVRAGDGLWEIDLGQDVPAGQYILKLKITDDTKTDDTTYAFYNAISNGANPLGDEYINQTAGHAAMAIISSESGVGFIPREVVTRIHLDEVKAGDVDLDKVDGASKEVAAGTNNLHVHGWMAANFDIEKYGYSINGGEIVYVEDFKKETPGDAEAIMDVAANFFSFEQNGYGYRMTADIPLQGGTEVVEVFAYINGEDVHFATFTISNPLEDIFHADEVKAGDETVADDGSATVENNVEDLKLNFWYAANKPIAKYGYSVDGGEVIWLAESLEHDGGADDQAIQGQAHTIAPTAEGFRFSGNMPLTEGEHTYVLVAAFDDGTTEDLYTVTVNREAAQQQNPPTAGAVVLAIAVAATVAGSVVLKKKREF